MVIDILLSLVAGAETNWTLSPLPKIQDNIGLLACISAFLKAATAWVKAEAFS